MKKILLLLMLFIPIHSMCESGKLTQIGGMMPYYTGVTFLQFNDNLATQYAMPKYGFAFGGNLNLTFDDLYEVSFGYHYTLIGDRSEKQTDNSPYQENN